MATEKEIYKHASRHISSVPDSRNKANVVVKRVTQIFLFPSAYRCLSHTVSYYRCSSFISKETVYITMIIKYFMAKNC